MRLSAAPRSPIEPNGFDPEPLLPSLFLIEQANQPIAFEPVFSGDLGLTNPRASPHSNRSFTSEHHEKTPDYVSRFLNTSIPRR